MAFRELSGNCYWKSSADFTKGNIYLQLGKGSYLHRNPARLFFPISLSRATTWLCWKMEKPRPALGSSALLLSCSPCGQIYRGHGKGQVTDRLAPTQTHFSESFRPAGHVCHFHHSFIIIRWENIETATEPTKIITVCHTDTSNAINWSLSAFKGSSLQNSKCQIMLPLKSCSQAVPSGGLTGDSAQVRNYIEKSRCWSKFLPASLPETTGSIMVLYS